MSTGALVLVATPIGNLSDMTARAVETLREANVIACEDTRHTRKLLNHFDVHGVPVVAVHEHNETEQALAIVERVRDGQLVALVTDAGMPAISDPGARVVAAVADAGLTVSVAPGPSAVVSALAVSGFPADRFCFEGFLPRKGAERHQRLTAIAGETRTTVVYEAPHRISGTVEAMAATCAGERRVVLARELTKLHEEVWRGTLSELVDRLRGGEVRGECVIVLAGAAVPGLQVTDEDITAALVVATEAGRSRRDAIDRVSADLAVPRNRVYGLAHSGNH